MTREELIMHLAEIGMDYANEYCVPIANGCIADSSECERCGCNIIRQAIALIENG